MKKHILICLMLALLLMGICSTAMAANVPEVSVVLSENRFTGPKEVTVTIRVANTADTDMPGPMALYDPSGARIVDFGTPTLAAGASKSWTGTWMVTEQQLAEGRLAFVIAYTMADDSGVLITKQQPFYCSIVNAGAEAKIEVKRTITPTTARQNQKVYVIYEISNVGGVDVTDVTIKESSAVSSEVGKIPLIKAGEKATYTFSVKMAKKSLSSHATVTAKAGDQTLTQQVDDATIKYGNVKLEAALKADKKGGPVGDTMKLTLTIKNTGKVDYQNVNVTDAVLGTVFSGLTVKAGETLTQEKELTIAQSGEYQFTVTGADSSGTQIETATDRISVIAVDPAKEVGLSVVAEADKSTIYMLPGIVKFTVHVTNTSAVDAKDVSVVSSGVKLADFDVIAPGQTRSFVRDVRVDIAGRFRFDAVTANQLGESVTYFGNEVPIAYSAPTATPSQVPLATPARPVLENVPQDDGLPEYVDTIQQALNIGFWVLLGLSGLCLALVIVGIAGRSSRAAQSSKAEDHLERDGYSDYTQAMPAKKRRVLPEEERADEDDGDSSHKYLADEPTDVPAPVVSEETAGDMQDAMNELYPDAAKEETATYRRRRTDADE